MTHRRFGLKCGVINGKIFAFGDRCRGLGACEGEVYDPKENTWSPIKTMPIETMSKTGNHHHTVEALGHELFYGGYAVPASDYGRNGRPECAVYNPAKDEWRDFEHFDREKEMPFVAHGHLHSMSKSGIYVHDVDSHSWRKLHTLQWAGVEDIGVGSYFWRPWFAKAVEDELLVLIENVGLSDTSVEDGVCFLQSKGFGGDKEEISWEKIPFEFPDPYCPSRFCPVSLLEL